MSAMALGGNNHDGDALALPALRRELEGQPLLHIEVVERTADTAVVRVAGEVDMRNLPRLRELVYCRLRSQLLKLKLELSGVTFMSIPTAMFLVDATGYGREHGAQLAVEVGGSRAVERVFRATGVAGRLTLV